MDYAKQRIIMRLGNARYSANPCVFVIKDTSRMPAAVRSGTFWAAPVARDELVSGSSGRGVVLLHHAGRDAPAVADRDALLVGPRPDVAAALAV